MRYIVKDKEDPNNSEAEKNIYSNIQNYYILKKLEKLMERNQLFIKFAISKFDKEDGINNLELLSTKKAYKQKLTRPTEIVKLCDNLA